MEKRYCEQLDNDCDSQVIDVRWETRNLPGRRVKIDSAELDPNALVRGICETDEGPIYQAAYEAAFWIQRLYQTTLADMSSRLDEFKYFYSVFVSSAAQVNPNRCSPERNSIECCMRQSVMAQVKLQLDRLTFRMETMMSLTQRDDTLQCIHDAIQVAYSELDRLVALESCGGVSVMKYGSTRKSSFAQNRRWAPKCFYTNSSNLVVETLNAMEMEYLAPSQQKYDRVICKVQSEREFISNFGIDERDFYYVNSGKYTRIRVPRLITFFHKLAVGLNRIHLLELKLAICELVPRIHRLIIVTRCLEGKQKQKLLKALKIPIYRYNILYQNYRRQNSNYRKLKHKYYWSFVELL